VGAQEPDVFASSHRRTARAVGELNLRAFGRYIVQQMRLQGAARKIRPGRNIELMISLAKAQTRGEAAAGTFGAQTRAVIRVVEERAGT